MMTSKDRTIFIAGGTRGKRHAALRGDVAHHREDRTAGGSSGLSVLRVGLIFGDADHVPRRHRGRHHGWCPCYRGKIRRSDGSDGTAGTMRHEQRLIFELWQLRQVMPKALDQEIESLGITMPQFGTLNAIAVAGPQSGADLARRADVRPQTMAAMLTGLADAGLLERRPHPVHKRILLADLTTAGRRLWRTASDRVGRVERRLHETLGDSGYEAMRAQTRALVAELGGSLEEQPAVWPWPR